ncbi:MAG TPA: hypothetical protein VFV34_27450 [Blastocatellia bacterium]|nr:hypothetical protein [Blastocatellia bacterium]
MNDDYLWDGSGEVDPEIESLEQSLGELRYRKTTGVPSTPVRRTGWRLFAAAAVVLAVIAGVILLYSGRLQRVDRETKAADKIGDTSPQTAQQIDEKSDRANEESPKQAVDRGPAPDKRPVHLRRTDRVARSPLPEPAVLPPIDFEIGRHIESAQLLLREFRNLPDGGRAVDVSYEKRRSRFLLQQNILLRRNAELEGELPVGEVLGGLEPFLLDIANLPEHAQSSDVAAIKDRIERREMIAALQVYSAVVGSN